jgi:hypothetical protein
VLDRAVVVWENGVITEVKEGGAAPVGAIDGMGALLIPGVVDMPVVMGAPNVLRSARTPATSARAMLLPPAWSAPWPATTHRSLCSRRRYGLRPTASFR